MGRKYGKNATTKNNVLKLVEALLALANGEIAVPGDKLKATFNVEWVKEDELLVSGKIQQKRNNKTQNVDKGITKDDLWALVECFGKALELSQPKDEQKVDNVQRRGEAIQDVLDCLKDLDILVLKPSAKTQGFWKFHLKLKHQTAEKKDNLKIIEKKIEEKWKIKIGSVTVEVSHETPKPEEETIHWQEICRQNLALQKELTTNLFTNACGMTPQLDGVYVPLAIVERQKPKPQPRNQQEEQEKETEKLIPIAEERFFEDVLRQGKSEISQGRKIAIIGEPGAGKTTRLQKIADWILEQELGWPIWIDLAELGEQDICQYLEKVWLSRCQGEVTRGDLEAQINRVWLLLDGVDEMTHVQGMQQLAKDLLRTWVQAARVVVTCRVNVWEADKNAFSGFDVFRNLEFNGEQVTEYIRRWFAGMGDAATGESLEAELAESENSRLKELIQNPLRLWMLCQIWSLRDGTLPDTQAKLYASFIEYFYRWKEQIIKSYEKLCGKSHGECQQLLHEGLGELAKAAIDGKSSRFRLSYRLVSEYLGDRNDETSLLSLTLSLGWLNRVGRDFDEPEESVYGFYHATFQEYFAALAVEDWDYFLPRNHVDFPVVGKEYRIFEAQWKQVILLWLGLEGVNRKQKEEFIEALVNFEDGCEEFYKYRAYFIAAAGISEYRDCPLTKKIIGTVFGWSSSFSSLAEVAKPTLLETDRTQAIDWLMKALSEFVTEKIPDYSDRISENLITEIKLICHESPESDIELLHFSEILGKLCPCNQLANDILLQVLKQASIKKFSLYPNYSYKDRLLRAIDTSRKIKIIEPEIINLLISLARSISDFNICMTAVDSLNEINKYLPGSIDEFVEWLVFNADPKYGRTQSMYMVCQLCLLGKSDRISSKFVRLAFGFAWRNNNYNICDIILQAMPIIHKQTIADDLVEYINYFLSILDGGYNITQAAWYLWLLDESNVLIIDILIQIINKFSQEFDRLQAAIALSYIDPENLLARQTLLRFLSNDEKPYCLYYPQLIKSLLKMDCDREIIVEKLLELIESSELFDFSSDFLQKISFVRFEEKQQYEIIYKLRLYLSNTEQKSVPNYDDCHSLLWNCAQNLPYPTFYQAWHHQLTTPHPEVPETTGVGSTPFTQSLNLADLPNILDARLADTQLIESVQLICIDTSKFIDTDNPALEIYEQFLDQNCPQRPNGEPETLPQLKSYWNRLRRDSDKHLIFIFYQDPTSPAAQGLSPTFLNALTRFDGTICLITDTPHPPLQTFSPHDSDLVQAVVNWLKRVHLES